MNILQLPEPVPFYRSLADLRTRGGKRLGVAAALMLSQAIRWTMQMSPADEWFCKTATEWEQATGLTRREQETARGRLREAGFWYEARRGIPARMCYRVDIAALSDAVREAQNG